MMKGTDQPSYIQPAEWASHKAVWTAWPAAAEYWQDKLRPAQEQFTEFCQHLSSSERMKILVANGEARKEAEKALDGLNVDFIEIPYGDIWLRDTAPIFTHRLNEPTQKVAVCFQFNGWGEKYVMAGDEQVALKIARQVGIELVSVPMVFEGGSLDVDGLGTALTTRQCLLNANRNPQMTVNTIEEILFSSLGVRKLLWLDEGLLNDHTDGHVDNIARFVGPGHVVCMKPSGSDDPNAATYEKIQKTLLTMSDVTGRPLRVTSIASPGLVRDEDGWIVPASHMNFYIGNQVVIVPVYGTPYDEQALAELAECFPGRKTVGVRANAILTGGGSFHCITQQEPL